MDTTSWHSFIIDATLQQLSTRMQGLADGEVAERLARFGHNEIRRHKSIFDNIRKFTNYLLSTSLGEVFVVPALSALGYFPLSAKMLLWVNVVTDLVPASALAADPAVPQVMKRRPRRHDEPVLNKAIYATIAGSIFRTLNVVM